MQNLNPNLGAPAELPVVHAKRLLRRFSNGFPKVWRLIDSMREELRGPEKHTSWPDWCFVTKTVAIKAMEQTARSANTVEIKDLAALFCSLAAWRLTEGVYSFDQDVFADLVATPIDPGMSCSAFYQLPQWSLFIETPGLQYAEKTLAGFFVSLDYGDTVNTLRLVLVTTCDNNAVIDLPLTSGTVNAMLAGAARKPECSGLDLPALLNLVLFCCFETQEVLDDEGRNPAHPRPVLVKKFGWRVFPVKKTVFWSVGDSIGKSLRRGGIAKSSGALRRVVSANAIPAHWEPQPGQSSGATQYIWVPTLPPGISAHQELPAYNCPTM